jgi:hypothetical protein
MISDFQHEVAENCTLLSHYAASSGNLIPMFQHNLSVQSSGFKNRFGFLDLMMGLVGRPEA